MERRGDYVVVGGGLAGVSAVEGIRERDRSGSLLLIGAETHWPYDRPPLSKKLWWGKKRVEDIPLKPPAFYTENGVELQLGRRVVGLDAGERVITDAMGTRYHYGKLLLATGGAPRRLPIPGGELEGLCYYRTLDDYQATRTAVAEGKPVVIIGGGFIGSELAASLAPIATRITMLFPAPHLVHKVFPEPLAAALTAHFRERGVRIEQGRPTAITREGAGFVVTADNGQRYEAGHVIVGVGITPDTGLASRAGIRVDNGILVDEFLTTSDPHVFAAGDNAFFHSPLQERRTRLEHWDNALQQGRYAGRNMAGAHQRYDYEPYFFSDLFEFGYEAVGEVNADLEIFADWREENRTGVIYYLREGRVRGVMLCNVWGKVEEARRLIRGREALAAESLRGRIR